MITVIAAHAALLSALVEPHVEFRPPELPVMQISMVMEAVEPIPASPQVVAKPVVSPAAMSSAAMSPAAVPQPEVAISEPQSHLSPAAPAPAMADPPVRPPAINPAKGSAPPIVYPSLSRRLGETGTVLLHLHVLADGKIGEAKVLRSSGFPRLDRAAADASLRWQLQPAYQGDEPIAMWYRWPVKFELE